jgi:hypothetical protein
MKRISQFATACTVLALLMMGALLVRVSAQSKTPDLAVTETKSIVAGSEHHWRDGLCKGRENLVYTVIRNLSDVAVPPSQPIEVRLHFRFANETQANFVQTLNGLGAHQSRNLEFANINIPTAGSLVMSIYVDLENRIIETDEKNNSEVLKYNVQSECPYPLTVRVRSVVNPGSGGTGGIGGATVTVGTQANPTTYGTQTTDTSGDVIFYEVVPGNIVIKASRLGCGSDTKNFTMPEASSATSVTLSCTTPGRP